MWIETSDENTVWVNSQDLRVVWRVGPFDDPALVFRFQALKVHERILSENCDENKRSEQSQRTDSAFSASSLCRYLINPQPLLLFSGRLLMIVTLSTGPNSSEHARKSYTTSNKRMTARAPQTENKNLVKAGKKMLIQE